MFKSGRVKLRIGDVLMDVSPGTLSQHRQDVGGVWQMGVTRLMGEVFISQGEQGRPQSTGECERVGCRKAGGVQIGIK